MQAPPHVAGTLQETVGSPRIPTGYQNKGEDCKNLIEGQETNIFQPHLEPFHLLQPLQESRTPLRLPLPLLPSQDGG